MKKVSHYLHRKIRISNYIKTKAILICNPNNPTGYLYTQREMNQIRDLVKKYDLFLFSDEVYREFCYTGAPYISAFHLEGIEEQVVLIDSVSKDTANVELHKGAFDHSTQRIKKSVMKFCQARLSPPFRTIVARGLYRCSRKLYAFYL